MKIAADANLLVRAITGDDERQSAIAQQALASAEAVALPLAALCETVWVLSRGYRFPLAEVADVIRRLIGSEAVRVNRPAAEAGLAMLEAGGDFADGVIAWEGKWLGADSFVSFDRQAVELLTAKGHAATLLT